LEDVFWSYYDKYGYWAVFIGVAIDHTGTPTVLIFSRMAAGTGKLSFWMVLFCAFWGAQVSDLIAYFFGKLCGRPLVLRYGKYVRLKKDKFEKVEEYLKRNPFLVIVWGRFLALIGRYVALVCGVCDFNFGRYLLYNSIGNFIFVLAYGTLCYALGEKLEKYLSNSYYLLIATVAIIVIHVGITYLISKLKRKKK
jgi:membrane protein DedA with SNARE-associated domain